jgi:hypothetical protein
LPEPEHEVDIEQHVNGFVEELITRSVLVLRAHERITEGLRELAPRLHTLDLSGTHAFELFPGIHQVHHLNLSGCSKLRGMHNLSTLSSVDLSYCHDLVDLEPLRDVVAYR